MKNFMKKTLLETNFDRYGADSMKRTSIITVLGNLSVIAFLGILPILTFIFFAICFLQLGIYILPAIIIVWVFVFVTMHFTDWIGDFACKLYGTLFGLGIGWFINAFLPNSNIKTLLMCLGISAFIGYFLFTNYWMSKYWLKRCIDCKLTRSFNANNQKRRYRLLQKMR